MKQSFYLEGKPIDNTDQLLDIIEKEHETNRTDSILFSVVSRKAKAKEERRKTGSV